MTYPTSSVVTAGMPTAAAHYNNLRLDALTLGQAEADAVMLAALLGRFESFLRLEILGTTRLRVTASASEPVSLVVDGCPVQATANVDLASGDAPSGAAGWWYVFANHTAGYNTFTLDVNSSAVPAAGSRLIGRFYWTGTRIDEATIRTYQGLHQDGIGLPEEQHKQALVAQGRLTLTSGVPVVTGSASGSTLYYTPYVGDRIHLYNANLSRWVLHEFAELSVSIASATANKNYDVFIYDSNGTPTLSTTAWSTDTTRATALTTLDGVYVKSGATNYRYLGTIRIGPSTGVALDDMDNRYVWNYFNRLARKLYTYDATASWTYAVTSTWRQWNGTAANKVEFVVGVEEDPLFFEFWAVGKNSAGVLHSVGIGLDTTTANSAHQVAAGSGTGAGPLGARYQGLSGLLGYHALNLLEYAGASGTATFYGISAPILSAGMGYVMG